MGAGARDRGRKAASYASNMNGEIESTIKHKKTNFRPATHRVLCMWLHFNIFAVRKHVELKDNKQHQMSEFAAALKGQTFF